MTEQFRLARVQLVNWGTFHGYFDIPVGQKGFLITGASGSGKSTLIDAFSTILVPQSKIRYNAAAQQDTNRDKGRSRVSYIRGAWRRSEDPTTGEIRSQYLREGATATVVAMTYRSKSETYTLVAIFRLNAGQNSEAQVKTLYGIFPDEVDVDTFMPHLVNSLDKRKLEQQFKTPSNGVTFTDQYSVFANRFRARLGIDSEDAQMLLHRTQSAKSLRSMDELFREYMLEKPLTFELAKEAVATHGDLRYAYERLEDLNRQIEALAPLPGLQHALEEAQAQRAHAEESAAALPSVRRAIEAAELRDAITTYNAQREAVKVQESTLSQRKEAQQAAVQRAYAKLGGYQAESITVLSERIEREQRELESRTAKAKQLEQILGVDELTTELFAELKAQARREVEEAPAERAALDAAWSDARAEKRQLEQQERAIEQELVGLGKRENNIDQGFIDLRAQMCYDTNIDVQELPFVGELIDVLDSEAEWEPVIQRLLSNFAITLLVPEEHERAVNSWVNSRALGRRLEYRTVPAGATHPRRPKNTASLFHKIRVVKGAMQPWLEQVLASTFDYALVRTVEELEQQTQRAATIDGLERNARDHTKSTRYVKDDRRRLGQRRDYRLGSSNHAKLESLRTALKEARQETTAAHNRVQELQRKRDSLQHRLEQVNLIAEMEWEEVDKGGVEKQLVLLREELELSTSSPEARQLSEAYEDARATLQATEKELQEVQRQITVAETSIEAAQARLAEVELTVEVDPAIFEELESKLRSRKRRLTRENINSLSDEVQAELDSTLKRAAQAITSANTKIGNILTSYLAGWPSESAELRAEPEFAGEAINRLEALRADRLPEFRGRFLELLNGQSVMHLSHISTQLARAKGDIETNLGPINASLKRSPYTPEGGGRYLQIEVRDNRGPEVREFQQDLRDATAGSLSVADESEAIERYHRLAKIMDRLASSERADTRWRNLVLDTRRHVKFVGNEIDADGEVYNTHVDSASLSGGQAQKLVFFCLAAALRYRLAGVDADFPTYATVVLDEAFDRADPTFTRTAMDVFTSFGFHMILATPMKLIKTLSPYVDGTIVVNYTETPQARSTFEFIDTHDG
ncbi:ATP-binding protein [Corynebacterium sp. MSK044]|uniref:ATP-binding protein n=1 Tax=Corynebacterium sp. MSK044 TaxID=3050195 RepID=UPI00254E7A21|nr:ATP-binding protein [Corynebacterium sp. MSK044]MDK8797852.1 ATP-binding protein [Corynebacterium sp. MSK044]